MKDFFISYDRADSRWAEWIAWQLEEAGYSIIIQVWDFPPGSNIVLQMQKATSNAKLTIAVLSPNYLDATYTASEWAAAFRQDPQGENRTLLPIRVRPCELNGLLASIVYIDFVGLEDEALARDMLLKGVQRQSDRNKPDIAPSFPTEHTVARQSRFPGAPPPIWNVPHLRNPFFTGRELTLKSLYETLIGGRAKVVALSQVIAGLGGIGKTQIALEYAYRYRDAYRAVLWVKADTRPVLIADFSAIADLLGLSEKATQDPTPAAEAVKHWLEEKTDWLLILDNAERLSIVREFIPSIGKGHILITTREQATAIGAQHVEIERMEPEEGALFLLRRANIIRFDSPLDSASAMDRDTAIAISQVMDGLPLALDQAGAYIEETACGLSGYLELFNEEKQQRANLLKRRGNIVTGHPEPVATTWSLSFKKVERANLASAELLRLFSFLYHDEIPEEIITKGAPEFGPILHPVAEDVHKLNESLGELRKFSLIHRDTSAKTISIHRLVQAVLIDSIDEITQRQWVERTICAVDRAFPAVEFATWHLCQRLLPHTFVCANLIGQWSMESNAAARLLHHAGYYLQERAQYEEAESLCKQALVIREKLLKQQQLAMAESLNDLALLYRSQGKYSQAEPLYQQALEIRKRLLGEKHPDVAQSLHSLASLYVDQGKYSQAEQLYREALDIRNLALGQGHPEVAQSLNDLALLYRSQGKYSQSESLYQQALEIRERLLGKEHPNVATSLNNLALLYTSQGKYEQAEQLYQQALHIREMIFFGSEDPDIAQLLDNLGALYYAQGKYEQVDQLYRQALAIRERILGPNHPDVAQSLSNLAKHYRAQSKHAEAEQYYKQALAIREDVLGPDHPLVANTLNSLARLYRDRGDYEQAIEFSTRALDIEDRTLEPEHPEVAVSLNNLAELYRLQGKLFQAEPLYERALKIREHSLGTEHPEVAVSLNNLAELYRLQGKFLQSDNLHLRALAIRERNLRPEHPHLAQSFLGLARLRRDQGRYDQAEFFYYRTLEIREALGSEHPHVKTILKELASLYEMQGKIAELEGLAQQVLRIQERTRKQNESGE